MEGDTAETAVDQAKQLLGLNSLQASQVVTAESPAALQVPTKAAAASGSGGAGGCGNTVVAAAAAAGAAVVGVALAYLNLAQ